MGAALKLLCCLLSVLGAAARYFSSSNALQYHFRPENVSNDSCPEPCYILSQYVGASVDLNYTDTVLKPDVVMTFLPGEHVLNGTLIVAGANSFTMIGSELPGNSSVIETRGNIQITSVSEIRFSRLSFTSFDQSHVSDGVVISLTSFQSVNISNCMIVRFTGFFLQTGFGESGTIIIEKTIIEHNELIDLETRGNIFLFNIRSGYLDFVGNTVSHNNLSKSTLIMTFNTVITMKGNVFSWNAGSDCYFPMIQTTVCTVTLLGRNVFTLNQHVVWFATLADIFFEGLEEFSSNSACGGPLTAMDGTTLHFSGDTTFFNNTATTFGGGVIVSSSNIILQNASLLFESNTAVSRGGAIYVDGSSGCFDVVQPQCFLGITEESNSSLMFVNNNALVAGDDIYGGEIETCSGGLNAEIRNNGPIEITHDTPTISSISSDPMQVCLCTEEAIACCPLGGYYPDGVYVDTCPPVNVAGKIYPGQNITFHLLAVGQYLGATSADIRAFAGNTRTDFGTPTFAANVIGIVPIIDSINATCETVTYFPVFSNHSSHYVSLFPDGACTVEDALVIRIDFITPCPPGFMLSEESRVCECENRLQQFSHVTCDINLQSIQHNGSIWVGYYNVTNGISGLILHSSPCPFDYCITEDNVSFFLNNTDQQCDYNRSGLLCGQCGKGLSVLLGGTSKCRECSNVYLALLIPFSVAGIALLVVLFLLRFTVNYGTLNGLIFYANIVQVNRRIFFPSGDTNILTVFIAWLNLDLGIETCFYDGMDAYGKTWLQFVFPFYIWALLGLIFVISSHSRRVTKFLGSNPIAALATLFLISYLKVFRTIVAVFSTTTLDYPDDILRRVWQLDGNIISNSGKYLTIFLFALIIFVVLFIPYTILLLSGQWLLSFSHWKPLSWANSPRLRTLLDTYHAPYKDRHRYWTGLLLLFRIVISSLNALLTLYNPSFALKIFASASPIVGIVFLCLIWGWIVGGVYRRWPLNLLEGSFLVNLGLLAFATYHVRTNGGNQAATVYTSVSIALVTFVGILSYHVYVILCKSELVGSLVSYVKKKPIINNGDTPSFDENNANQPVSLPVKSVTQFVELREPLLEDHVP